MPVPTPQSILERVVSAHMTDVSAPSSAFAVAPVRGRISRAYSVLHGAITGSDAGISVKINGTAVPNLSWTITQSGSAAGDVDSKAINSLVGAQVNESDNIEFVSDGNSSTTAAATMTVVITRN